MFKFNFLPEDRREDEEPMSDEPLTVDVKQEFGSLDIGEVFLPREESRSKFEAYESDLVPNVYEGGFKTWECSHDLVDYLKCLVERCTEITTVLEVGCGSGLPGRELSQHRQFHVDFQDFNREVVEQTGRQLAREQRSYKTRLFFGDWKDLIGVLPSKHYDVILTSETIYNTSNYPKLVELFDHSLTSHGTIYLAAKVHYFGVQGGVRQFEDFLTQSGRFTSRVVRVIDANVKREILEITRSVCQ